MTNFSKFTFAKRASIHRVALSGSAPNLAIFCALIVSLSPALATEPFSGATIGNQIKESWAKQSASKDSKTKLAKATVETTIKAPKEFVWNALTDFSRYPRIFPKVKSCQVLKREGQLVYIESFLKPQLFVNEQCQHTINDLQNKPDCLRWKMVDGTFKAVEGEWQLKSVNSGRHCQVKYTLEVDPGPAIPRPIANMALKMTQKEIVGNFKQVVEKDMQTADSGRRASTSAVLEPES
ncbi:MAG: SRPBCC family protein [Candidatus Obscuribacterales bacterium]